MQTHTVQGGNGVELSVTTAGPSDGDPIVLVHGYSQSRMCWRNQYESDLTDEFRLVAPDLRGHGESDKPVGSEDYRDQQLWAADIRAVVETFTSQDPVFVGWSYAGLILCDYFAEQGTDGVAGLNLIGGITEKGTESAGEVAGEAFAEMVPDLEVRDAEQSVSNLIEFLDLVVADELSLEDQYFILGYNACCPPRVREALQDRSGSHVELLPDFDMPTLLTHGRADQVVLPAAAERHADLIPDAELSIYDGVGHAPFWEAPDRFNDELRAFARRCHGAT